MSSVEKCYNIYLFLPVINYTAPRQSFPPSDKLHGKTTTVHLLYSTFYENSEAAGGRASLVFSHTFVHPTVFGEDLGDHQSVRVSVILVTEVLAVGDLFSTFVPLDLRRA